MWQHFLQGRAWATGGHYCPILQMRNQVGREVAQNHLRSRLGSGYWGRGLSPNTRLFPKDPPAQPCLAPTPANPASWAESQTSLGQRTWSMLGSVGESQAGAQGHPTSGLGRKGSSSHHPFCSWQRGVLHQVWS